MDTRLIYYKNNIKLVKIKMYITYNLTLYNGIIYNHITKLIITQKKLNDCVELHQCKREAEERGEIWLNSSLYHVTVSLQELPTSSGDIGPPSTRRR